jgi:hypothetical protein
MRPDEAALAQDGTKSMWLLVASHSRMETMLVLCLQPR